MATSEISYAALLSEAKQSGASIAGFLRDELPYIWQDVYLAASDRPTNILLFTYGSFDYLYDAYQQLEPHDADLRPVPIEARLVAAIGYAEPKRGPRDDDRLRGMKLSSMPETSGPWDRGHFIAHSIGGTVDGNEANVFLQRRKANRGSYRVMEAYCFKHPGVLCFSRPVYSDVSAHPHSVDFGVLKPEGEFWVQSISNRL